MNKLKAVIPYPLKRWVSNQDDPIEVLLVSGYGMEMWVVNPPYEIKAKDNFSSRLYSNMFNECDVIKRIEMYKEELSLIYRYPNDAENTDYELDDFREVEMHG